MIDGRCVSSSFLITMTLGDRSYKMGCTQLGDADSEPSPRGVAEGSVVAAAGSQSDEVAPRSLWVIGATILMFAGGDFGRCIGKWGSSDALIERKTRQKQERQINGEQ